MLIRGPIESAFVQHAVSLPTFMAFSTLGTEYGTRISEHLGCAKQSHRKQRSGCKIKVQLDLSGVDASTLNATSLAWRLWSVASVFPGRHYTWTKLAGLDGLDDGNVTLILSPPISAEGSKKQIKSDQIKIEDHKENKIGSKKINPETPWLRQQSRPPFLLHWRGPRATRLRWSRCCEIVIMAPALQNDIAPATKRDATTLPSIAPAAKSNTAIAPFASIDPATKNDTRTWLNIAPAMEGDATTSPNIAPATKETF